MIWQWPFRSLACYSLLPEVHEHDVQPRLLDACNRTVDTQLERLATDRGYRLTVCDLVPKDDRVVKADLTALPFEDGSFLGVISSDTLEHIETWPRAVREIHRILEPGGFLILGLPVAFLDRGEKLQATRRACEGHVSGHAWDMGMDAQGIVEAHGFRTIFRGESFDFSRMHASMIYLMEKP
jgi:SAM-dependent methyltransferase